jgi:hypothetical protein
MAFKAALRLERDMRKDESRGKGVGKERKAEMAKR